MNRIFAAALLVLFSIASAPALADPDLPDPPRLGDLPDPPGPAPRPGDLPRPPDPPGPAPRPPAPGELPKVDKDHPWWDPLGLFDDDDDDHEGRGHDKHKHKKQKHRDKHDD